MRILVVDDDRAVRESLRRSLTFNGYTVETAGDGLEALERSSRTARTCFARRHDAADGRVGGVPPTPVGRRRPADPGPTARDSVSERVASGRRCRRLPGQAVRPRRTPRPTACTTAPPPRGRDSEALEFEDLRLDPVTRDVTRGERAINLTRTEFALLEMLMANPRRVLSAAASSKRSGADFPTSGNALEVYVGYLRRKTEAEGSRD